MWSHLGGTDIGLLDGRRQGCRLRTRRGETGAMMRMGTAFEGMWCEVPRSACASSCGGGGGVQSR